MAIYAKVTRVMTTDFAEVSILDGIDGEPIDDTTYIAEFEGKKDNVRRDDIVEVVTAENRIMNESRIAYILPVVGAVLGSSSPEEKQPEKDCLQHSFSHSCSS